MADDPSETTKAAQILAGARAAFVELGYEGTSVEEIARRAGVSKATLYSHFTDKRAIFSAFIRHVCQQQVSRLIRFDQAEETAAAALGRIARDYIEFLLSPFAMSMFRLIVAEVQRFPEIGREFLETGPDQAMRRLAQLLAAADARGELQIPDAYVAAHQFAALCRGDLFFRWLLRAKTEVTPAEIAEAAQTATTAFLNAYRRTSETVSPAAQTEVQRDTSQGET
ncbi:MAG TPA: TetR/AcrR family transcriptional regulator [Pirellulales bacterium]|jgi:AcrR family transcriptional regulator|nr:TetR/AcrR family transcriptional regulator [Pirellulales bacterium]